jgi:hypothetical protein
VSVLVRFVVRSFSVELLIARTEDTAVAVTGIRAYPTGFAFTISIRLHRPPQQEQPHSGHGILAMLDDLQPTGQVDDAFLRLGCASPTAARPPTSTASTFPTAAGGPGRRC